MFGLPHPYLGLAYLFEKQDQHGASGIRQTVRPGVADQLGQLADVARTPPCDQPELGEMTAHRVDQRKHAA
jgi:hypothetical protein